MSIVVEVHSEDKRQPDRIVLDDQTVAWVMEIADGSHQHPAVIIAAMLRDLRVDDQAAHMADIPGLITRH